MSTTSDVYTIILNVDRRILQFMVKSNLDAESGEVSKPLSYVLLRPYVQTTAIVSLSSTS